jgi:hypothetical protein
MWYYRAMKNARSAVLVYLAVLYGCAAGNVSPGPTLLTGIKQYEAEMLHYGNSSQRWPERQRAAGALKTVILVTLGESREFYRLVDMDLKRREYLVTMRETSLRPGRLQEMKTELADMVKEADRLKPVVQAQMAALPAPPEGQRVEAIATQGLLKLALDALFPANSARGLEAPSAIVDQHMVTDLGAFSTVRAPGGQTYRCALFGVEDEGAGMRCEAIK